MLNGLNPMPRILVHACCAPCSTVAISRLTPEHHLTLYYHAPNIHPKSEYLWRRDQLQKLCSLFNQKLIVSPYDPSEWEQATAPFRHLPEGSQRCEACYHLRMIACARTAKQEGFDAYTVTLTVSRYKNSNLINEIGSRIAKQIDIEFLAEDFCNNNGYQESIAMSQKFGLRRQNYCGCILSKTEAEHRKKPPRKAPSANLSQTVVE